MHDGLLRQIRIHLAAALDGLGVLPPSCDHIVTLLTLFFIILSFDDIVIVASPSNFKDFLANAASPQGLPNKL